tara:strand:- start:63 stop:917 length:855 start_codon:yes stop_codon:yes gene_type:complete
MKTIRIISRLDIKGPNMVKGIHLEGLRVLGNPVDYAKYYYENGADEILLIDVVASLYDRNSLHSFIKEISKNVFIPITVGGGIRTIDDINSVLRSGADKIVLNTAAVKNPNFIKDAVNKFGSSTISIAIEAIKNEKNKFIAFTDNGRECSNLNVVDWAKHVEDLGAGEIILTSVDNEGTAIGYNLELVNKIADNAKIPIVVHGGAGNKKDVLKIIMQSNCDAVCASSIFHYKAFREIFINKNVNYVTEGNFDFMKSGVINKKIKTINIYELKEFLIDNNISIRN